MDVLTQLLLPVLYGLLALLAATATVVLVRRFAVAWIERRRAATAGAMRASLAKALGELADPNNNGVSWIAKELKPRNAEELLVLKRVMTDMSPRLTDDERWRLSELYEATGLLASDMKTIYEGKWYEKANALFRLGTMRTAAAIEGMTSALRDKSEDVRLMAIWALAEVSDPRSVPAVVVSLANANGWELMQASNCLLGMSVDLTHPILELLRTSGGNRDRRERIAGTVLDLMAEFGLRGRDRLNCRACRQAVIEQMRSGSVDIRARALRALSVLGIEHQDEFALILGCLKDASWEIRAVAARALGELNFVEAIPMLTEAVSDQAWWVRHNAARSLEQMGDLGREALDRLRHSQDRFARETASQIIGERQLAYQHGAS